MVAVHAEFFEDAGFAGGGAGGVVVLEPLEAVGGACCGAVGGGKPGKALDVICCLE